jgi:hypothetical protein
LPDFGLIALAGPFCGQIIENGVLVWGILMACVQTGLRHSSGEQLSLDPDLSGGKYRLTFSVYWMHCEQSRVVLSVEEEGSLLVNAISSDD